MEFPLLSLIFHHSQINPLQQIPPLSRLSSPSLRPINIKCTPPILIHSIILTLRKPILPTPIMRQHRTINRRSIIARDRANYNPIRAGGFIAGEFSRFEDGEFEVGLLGVGEGEVLVVYYRI